MRDRNKPSSSEKNKEVEHLYVDFTHMVISEKLRNMSDFKSKDDVPSFDGIFYSSWIVKSGSEDERFYLLGSIQKLIDYQWEESKLILKPLFTMYIVMFCIPVVVTFFASD